MADVANHNCVDKNRSMHSQATEQLASQISPRSRPRSSFDTLVIHATLDALLPPVDEAHVSSDDNELISGNEAVPQDGLTTSKSLSVDGQAQDDPLLQNTQPPLSRKAPFSHWMNSLRKRALHRVPEIIDSDYAQEAATMHDGHRKSPSESSMGLVHAVRSASISLASFSVRGVSRRNTLLSRARTRTEVSSRASFAAGRISEDAVTSDGSTVPDLPALQRSMQRRKILEELLSTEESYIGDLRFLANVYITTLASLPTLSAGLRTSINHNITHIIQLHDEILGDLHRVVPNSEYTQIPIDAAAALDKIREQHDTTRVRQDRHRRWRSFDTSIDQSKGEPWLSYKPGIFADPQIVAEVAKVFGHNLSRFFIYQEYSAKFELMKRDAKSAMELISSSEDHLRGLEALASTVGSARSFGDGKKKALSVGDLLMKPVQRICKYPLLFSELLKYTPEEDCANSHMEVEDILFRMREATAEINRATSNPQMKAVLERTWLLQDRLVFKDRKFDSISKNQIRSLGRVSMCGALHVCWQTETSVDGHYLVCALYADVLCLASAGKVEPIYTIVACIRLAGARVTEVDNGRGLQCHTAPHSWKLVFECDHQLYELIMTACTPREELEWRARLNQPRNEGRNAANANLPTSVSSSIKSIGAVLGRSGHGSRRSSVHRATTSGTKPPLFQVILKGTSADKDDNNLRRGMHRSQSLLSTTSKIPSLAPQRSERARLELLLTDVWTRDILPFPVMAGRPRSSASSMMRKLSVASITSTLTKRPGPSHQASHRTFSSGQEPVEQPDSLVRTGINALERATNTVTRNEHRAASDPQSDDEPWFTPSGKPLAYQAHTRRTEATNRWKSTDRTKTDTTDEGTLPTTVPSESGSGSPRQSQEKPAEASSALAVGDFIHLTGEKTSHTPTQSTINLSRLATHESKRELRNRGLRRFFRS